MKTRIDIHVPEQALAGNPQKVERLQRTYRFEETDRVPVVVDAQLWFLLKAWGGSFAEMCEGPRQHLHAQILNQKWRIENIRDDRPIETEALVIESDFSPLRAAEFSMEIEWNGDESPKVKHPLQSPEQIDRLAVPPPDGGFNKKRVEWYLEMRELADDFDVRLNGEPLPVRVDLTHPGGPFPSAFALCGTNVFLWMKTDPERFQRLMEITTQSHLNVLSYFAALTGRDQNHSIWMGADAAEMMRADDFRRFIVPYYLEIWEKHARPRTFHMCGNINHLLEVLLEELQIEIMDGFGFPVKIERLTETLAAKVVLRGGPHPLVIHDGPPEVVRAECTRYLEALGPKRGYILAEGFGLMPGTPLENIEAMVEASRQASRS